MAINRTLLLLLLTLSTFLPIKLNHPFKGNIHTISNLVNGFPSIQLNELKNLKIETLKRCRMTCSGVFNVNFKDIQHTNKSGIFFITQFNSALLGTLIHYKTL